MESHGIPWAPWNSKECLEFLGINQTINWLHVSMAFQSAHVSMLNIMCDSINPLGFRGTQDGPRFPWKSMEFHGLQACVVEFLTFPRVSFPYVCPEPVMIKHRFS